VSSTAKGDSRRPVEAREDTGLPGRKYS
jgi:hypothetical protein